MRLTFEMIKRHYRRAERAIKRCDSLADAVPTPAINQLRYAGYHILVAISADKDGDVAKMEQELLEADEHCTRAWLDAFDSVTRYHLKVIRAFEERQYPLRMIEKHIPDFIAGLVTVDVSEHRYIVWLGRAGVCMFAILLMANLVPVGKRIIKKCRCGKRPDWDA